MEIRAIENKDLLQFLTLAVPFYQSIESTVNEFGAINTIMYEINMQDSFTAIGLFDGDELKGFVKGHCFSKKRFHFSGIYVIIKNNRFTKQLIEYCFDLVKQKGYSAWSVNATNSNIASIMEKYGAKLQHGLYVKEID